MSGSKEVEDNTNEDDDEEDYYDGDDKNHEVQIRSRSRSGSAIDRDSPTIDSVVMKSRNAFLNFISEYRQLHPGMKSSEIFKICGKKWRTMTEVEKKPYVDAANIIKQRGKIKKQDENPDESSEDDKTRKNSQHELGNKNNDSDSGSAMGSLSDDISGTS